MRALKGNLTTAIACLAIGAIFSTAALAAPLTAAQAIAARQAGYKQVGGAFKTINDQLKADNTDMAAVLAAAKVINANANAVSGWFPAGSGPEAGVPTKAKPEIWSDSAGFAAAAAAFRTQAGAMQAAAQSGDKAAVAAQVGPLFGACRTCHTAYRAQ
ncbi:MAG: cytochrome c [Caulobacteraceae bacterium]